MVLYDGYFHVIFGIKHHQVGFVIHLLSLDDCQDFNILPVWEVKVFESNFYTI